VSAAAPEGEYRLEIGLYGLVDGQRLPVTRHDWQSSEGLPVVGSDAAELGTIRVAAQ
jgi:hypothetical protein